MFIIGPDKKIKLSLTYPASTGRNFDELLRVIDSLQLAAVHKLATPADWQSGDDCIIVPSVSNEEAGKLFPGGFEEIKPYLRTTRDPRGGVSVWLGNPVSVGMASGAGGGTADHGNWLDSAGVIDYSRVVAWLASVTVAARSLI